MIRGKPQMIYVSGPIRAPSLAEIEANVYKAVDVGIALWKMGHYPYIPQLTHWLDLRDQAVNDGKDKLTWADYMLADYEFVGRCDALYFIGHSPGADLELDLAESRHMPVYYSLDEVPAVTFKRPSDEDIRKLFTSRHTGQRKLTEFMPKA